MSGFATGLASTFADVLTGATDWRDAVSSVLSEAGDSLIRSGIGGIGSALKIPGFANGTSFAPGGLSWVGERGKELMYVPRGAKVIPNNRLGALGSSPVLNYAPVIDARGADSAALARLEVMMRQQASDFERTLRDRVMEAVSDPRFRGRG